MKESDRQLGMGAKITRRDFLDGVGIAVGAALLPGCTQSHDEAITGNVARAYYPPALTGMRGSHAGSFEAAHAAVQGQKWTSSHSGEHYDLVVVGAGISGLAAAYFHRRDIDPDARILILDNHDDFGGHAKRNEFMIDGRTIIGFGGTMFIEAPRSYPPNARQLLKELDIDGSRESETHNWDLFSSHGLGAATFFDKETFGADRLVSGNLSSGPETADAPLSDAGKQDLDRLFADDTDFLDGMSPKQRLDILRRYSYRDYLAQFGGFGEEVLKVMQKRPHGVWAIGADALPAWMAWAEDYPGFFGTEIDLGAAGIDDDGRFHFPDGNASVARSLVRKLIPSVAPGNTMDDIVTAKFDYEQLDRDENPTRIRLNSTVVGMEHRQGDSAGRVDVTYVAEDAAKTVTAGRVVWAGYHALVPFICPDVSAEQAGALGSSVRAPLVYTNVLIRNWQSFRNLGFWRATCPGSFFSSVRIDFPVSIGDYRFSEGPDEPVVLHLQHIPTAPGLPAPDQFRAGRAQLLETPFEDFERHVRDQLGRMLGPGGFDPARDIAAITVNRWPHGYAYSVDSDSGEVAWWPEAWPHENKPWVNARQRIGNIGFAGIGSASNAMTEAAIEEAHRAVHSFASGESR